jgi:ATPase subunit of ABC transporter with duplicated ATPase domains
MKISIFEQSDVWSRDTSCAGHRTREHCALSAMLTVSQLSKSFAGRALFDDVSLQVNRGDRIGLVGPNGAGKSTLFALLLGRPLLGISNGADTISLLNATTGAIWSNRRVQIAVITIEVSVALLVSAKRFYGAR